MQADSDLERNETESRVDHVSGHVEDPGDQAAGPLHAHYSNLYLFYLHPMAVAPCLVICSFLCIHFSTSSPFSLYPTLIPHFYKYFRCRCLYYFYIILINLFCNIT